jgi:hypothetical protein
VTLLHDDWNSKIFYSGQRWCDLASLIEIKQNVIKSIANISEAIDYGGKPYLIQRQIHILGVYMYVWAHFGSSLIIQDGVKQF